MQQQAQSDEAAGKIQQKLRHVGPDDGFHAAFERVQDRQRNYDEHREAFRSSQRHADHQCDCGDAYSFRQRARSQKRQSRNRAHFCAEALFDKRVRGQKLATKIPRKKQNRYEEAADDVAEHQLQKRKIAGVSNSRRADNRERGRFRGHDGKRQSPPGRVATTQEIIFGGMLLLAEAKSEKRDAQ